MMKKIAILLVSAALLPLVSCEKDTQTSPPTPADVPVTGVELNVAELELVVGETAVLTATVLPEDATDKTVTWSSSAHEIASVDENGEIEGLAAGKAVISVTTADGGKTAECTVTVIEPVIPVESVSLDVQQLELAIGETYALQATVLPENATDKSATWSSSAPEIVSIDENGTVEGLAKGDAVITVTTTDGGKTAECAVTVAQTINGYEYVDLGLSVKWAACNIGAENPWDYGDYFAWGEIAPKEEYSIDNCTTYEVELPDISGNPDYDAAAANWGGTWRMPTKDEMQELVDICTWTWTSNEGNNGYDITGPNGNSIFLPAIGWRGESSLGSDGGLGMYWDSTPLENDPSSSSGLNFYNSGHLVVWSYRYYGRSIRPVSD